MAAGRAFRINEWTVEPGSNRIRGAAGTRKLRPQIMDLLVYLAEHQGRVVSADELLDELWAGRIVTPASIYNSVAELRQALADGNEDAVYVETIPKSGYRLVAAVKRLPEDESRAAGTGPAGRSRLIVPGLLAAIVGALLAWTLIPERQAERSIAVLPFEDMSPAGDLAWFSDGVTEEILNSLARLPQLKVAARTSAFEVRKRGLSVSEIARVLDVEFIVEGSVRRDGDSVRVTYQLIRAEDGFHETSDTIDLTFRDILVVQERIAETIAGSLDVALDEESRKAMSSLGTRDVEAYEYYLRGKDLLYDWFATGNTESIWSATEWFERAIDEDARFSYAHALRAHTFMRFLEGIIPSPYRPDDAAAAMDQGAALGQLRASLSDAAGFAPSPATKNLFEIWLMVFSDDFRSLPALAGRFDPSVADEIADGFDVYAVLTALLVTGRTGAALDFSERRIRRNPLDGLGYNQAWSAAMIAGQRERAAKYLERAIENADDVEFTEQNLLFTRIVERDWTAAAELAERPGWGIEPLRESILAFVYSAAGRFPEARTLVDRHLRAGRSGPYLALALRGLGRHDEARAMVARIDAAPAGNLIGMFLFSELAGQFPYDPDWMPNFSARMAEAGIVLEPFTIESSRDPGRVE